MPSIESLLARRNGIITTLVAAEKTRDSGWHPADGGSLAREKKGELPLSERIIVLQDDDQMFLVGPDLATVGQACSEWLPSAEKQASVPGARRDLVTAVKVVKRFLERPRSEMETFSTQEWNGINQALQESRLDKDGAPQGIQVVSAGV